MRTFVTGCTGQLGAVVVRQLLEAGHSVAALIRPTSDLWRLADIRDQIQFITGDLSEPATAAPGIAAFRPEVVYHLAWHGVAGSGRNTPEQIEVNVPGTLQLYRMARRAGCQVFVGVGSQAEYGIVNAPLSETTPAAPVTAYGTAKLATGQLLQALGELSGVRTVWVRLLTTYGPKEDESRLIPSVLARLFSRQTPALTPGEQEWDYLYVDDAAAALIALAETPAASGVFVLGSGQAVRVRTMVEQIRDQAAPGVPLGFGAIPFPADQPILLVADTRKIQSITGWKPAWPLDAGLASTIAWYQHRRAAKEVIG